MIGDLLSAEQARVTIPAGVSLLIFALGLLLRWIRARRVHRVEALAAVRKVQRGRPHCERGMEEDLDELDRALRPFPELSLLHELLDDATRLARAAGDRPGPWSGGRRADRSATCAAHELQCRIAAALSHRLRTGPIRSRHRLRAEVDELTRAVLDLHRRPAPQAAVKPGSARWLSRGRAASA